MTRQDLDEALQQTLDVMTWRMMGMAIVLLGLLALGAMAVSRTEMAAGATHPDTRG